ncbi:MAG: glycoside hydrolase family 44 protein [Candidatus Acidiferrales bacterium]
MELFYRLSGFGKRRPFEGLGIFNMKNLRCAAAVLVGIGMSLLASGCGSSVTTTTPPPVNSVTSVTVTPNPAPATIGTQVQFSVTVTGTGNFSNAVTWSVLAPQGSTLSPGTISTTGLYTTPYPAPATVTVVATSTQDNTKSGSSVVTLSALTTTAGPSLTVDAGSQTHAISPHIYGMNAYLLNATTADATAAKNTNIAIDRWGGDSTSRYNYLLDVTNSAADWYFENGDGTGGDGSSPVNGVTAFDALVMNNNSIGAKTLGTVPVQGWVAKDNSSCSFPAATYPSQYSFDPYNHLDCGDGELPDQSHITGNDPTVTSTAVGPSWTGSWVTYLVGKFGTAANGGVAIYDLDNEPSWWDATQRDVHPLPFTYDEVTTNGINTALAIKTADPTAEVSGPVMDFWWDYFYSKQDVESGWNSGPPCYAPWSNPIDRVAHSGTPFIEYYLQKFAAASQANNNVRLLDYLDLHTYFAASYNGSSVAFTTAGDTGTQQARLNSTRVLWDPTYTDPNFQQPNYTTDPNYTASCSPPLQAPQVIPMMKTWVANDYPGTKLAIDEYNWGGLEAINGALAQADILGIFGREGLDLATLWPTTNPSSQIPGMMSFEIYRNYDGANSTFGDTALLSTSADQASLSVYGALRTSDNVVTVVVINKTYGDLTATLSLANLSPNGKAKVFLYSNANLAAIVPQPDLTVTPPAGVSTTSSLSTIFPAQSITLIVVPKM